MATGTTPCAAESPPPSPATRQVLYVMGTAYCGSTLLNHLLDAQPGVRGLSEASCWFLPDTDAWCSRCRVPITRCPTWDQLAFRPDFYRRAFALYPDAHTVVNCGKHPSMVFRRMPLPPAEIACRAVVLSKMPHEFAWSYMHHDGGDVESAMRLWIDVNGWILTCLRAAAEAGSTFHKHLRCPPIAVDDVLAITYRQLALEPARTVERICRTWDMPYDPLAGENPWRRPSDTCMAGGNTALYAQATDTAEFFHDANYLGGKYVGKRHSVFLDRQWRADARFVDSCRRCYREPSLRAGIDAVAADLGYPGGIAALAEDLA